MVWSQKQFSQVFFLLPPPSEIIWKYFLLMNIPGWLWSVDSTAACCHHGRGPMAAPVSMPLVLPAKAGQVGSELHARVLCQTVKNRGIPPYKNHGSPPFALSPLRAWASPRLPTLCHAQPDTGLWWKSEKKKGTHHFWQKAMLQGSCPFWHPLLPATSACLSSPFPRCFHAAGRSGRGGKPTARCTSKAGKQNPREAAAGPSPSAPRLGWAGKEHHSHKPAACRDKPCHYRVQQAPEQAPEQAPLPETLMGVRPWPFAAPPSGFMWCWCSVCVAVMCQWVPSLQEYLLETWAPSMDSLSCHLCFPLPLAGRKLLSVKPAPLPWMGINLP